MPASGRARISASRTPGIVVLIAGGAALAAGYVFGRVIGGKVPSNNIVRAVVGALEPTGSSNALPKDAAQDFWAMDATATTRNDSVLISRSSASWPAILAGAAVIAAMTLVALSLG